MKKLKLNFRVTNNSYDLYGRLKLEALLDMFETSATAHDKAAHNYILDSDTFWIVSQTKLKFYDYQKVDEVTVETFYNKPNRFDIIRNYYLKNGEEVLASGASKWLVVDRKTTSFVSLAKFLNGEDSYLEEEVFPYKSFKKLKPFDFELDYLTEFSVKQMDLDTNIHLNNTRYLYHIANALNLASDEYIDELDMCYLKEIKFHTTVKVYAKRMDKVIYLEIRDEDFVHSRLKITLK